MLLTTWSAQAGESTVSTNRTIHLDKLSGSEVAALQSASGDYLQHLQATVDYALLNGFTKFGTDRYGYHVSRGVVKLRVQVNPNGQCSVERVLSNTSDPIGEYVAVHAVRTTRVKAFPTDLSLFIPTGLSMEMAVSYQDYRTEVALTPRDQQRADPAQAEDGYLQKEMTFHGVATQISQVVSEKMFAIGILHTMPDHVVVAMPGGIFG